MYNAPALPPNKTKLVCTIGPATDSPDMLEKMLLAGMNIARLNFSHGDFRAHGEIIRRIREAARATQRPVAIMADLPGPKIRIGTLAEEPVELRVGSRFTLTSRQLVGNRELVSVSLPELPRVVRPDDVLFINDGLIQVRVETVEGDLVHTRVVVGGTLRSKKGLNLPGIDLGISAFTAHDRDCMRFALENGVDAISQSFVNSAADIADVRRAAAVLLGTGADAGNRACWQSFARVENGARRPPPVRAASVCCDRRGALPPPCRDQDRRPAAPSRGKIPPAPDLHNGRFPPPV